MDKEGGKKLDEFTGKLLKDLSRETPSFDFTTKVMSQLDLVSQSRISAYKPLISKEMWLVLGIFIAGIFTYVIFGNLQAENSWMATEAQGLMPVLYTFTLPDYKISQIFIYGVVGFTIFAGIQIFMLKHHFNKQFVMH